MLSVKRRALCFIVDITFEKQHGVAQHRILPNFALTFSFAANGSSVYFVVGAKGRLFVLYEPGHSATITFPLKAPVTTKSAITGKLKKNKTNPVRLLYSYLIKKRYGHENGFRGGNL